MLCISIQNFPRRKDLLNVPFHIFSFDFMLIYCSDVNYNLDRSLFLGCEKPSDAEVSLDSVETNIFSPCRVFLENLTDEQDPLDMLSKGQTIAFLFMQIVRPCYGPFTVKVDCD